MRRRHFYEKPSDKTPGEKTEAVGRRHNRVRKQAIRDELIRGSRAKFWIGISSLKFEELARRHISGC